MQVIADELVALSEIAKNLKLGLNGVFMGGVGHCTTTKLALLSALADNELVPRAHLSSNRFQAEEEDRACRAFPARRESASLTGTFVFRSGTGLTSRSAVYDRRLEAVGETVLGRIHGIGLY